MSYRAKTCLRIVLGLAVLTIIMYFLGEFYLSRLLKSRRISTSQAPENNVSINVANIVNKERKKIAGENEGKDDHDQRPLLDRQPISHGRQMVGTEKSEKGNGDYGRLRGMLEDLQEPQGNSSQPSQSLPDCEKALANDKLYLSRWKAIHGRWRLEQEEPQRLPMDCQSIWARNGFAGQKKRGGKQQANANFPVAFARNVFKDYRFLEMELLANYSPNNWYCYSVDAKSRANFKQRLRALGRCLPNVLVVKREFRLNSKGHYASNALLECARELARPERKWHYLITLQNHDVQMKSNLEMGEILSKLNGANDIEFDMRETSVYTKERLQLYLDKYDWSFKKLKIFKSGSKLRHKYFDSDGQPLQVRLAKGSMSASLSRQLVDYIVYELDLTVFLKQLNDAPFGVDEHWIQSLVFTKELFPAKQQIQRTTGEHSITRYAIWVYDQPVPSCHGLWRHSVCVFGLADLADHFVANDEYLFANKMLPQEDMAAIYCWHKEMKMRNGN